MVSVGKGVLPVIEVVVANTQYSLECIEVVLTRQLAAVVDLALLDIPAQGRILYPVSHPGPDTLEPHLGVYGETIIVFVNLIQLQALGDVVLVHIRIFFIGIKILIGVEKGSMISLVLGAPKEVLYMKFVPKNI